MVIYPECEHHTDTPEKLDECQLEGRDWRRGIDKENWENCRTVMNNNDIIEWHINHSYNPRRPPGGTQLRMCLAQNGCKQLLREYWIEY